MEESNKSYDFVQLIFVWVVVGVQIYLVEFRGTWCKKMIGGKATCNNWLVMNIAFLVKNLFGWTQTQEKSMPCIASLEDNQF